MLFGILLLLVTVGLVVSSAWLRMSHRRRKYRLSLEASETYLSREVRNVVANAGGIYVSLTLAAAFLKLELTEQLLVSSIAFDPIAVLSLALALLQPLVLPDNS